MCLTGRLIENLREDVQGGTLVLQEFLELGDVRFFFHYIGELFLLLQQDVGSAIFIRMDHKGNDKRVCHLHPTPTHTHTHHEFD